MSIRKDIQVLEYITEELVRYERENNLEMGSAFEEYEEAMEWLYDAFNGSPEYDLDHSQYEDVIEIVNSTPLKSTDNLYDFWKLEKRLEEYNKRGYDEMELIVRYRLEAEEIGKAPSARDARKSNHMPTQTAYFGENSPMDKWSEVRWRAGMTGHEKLGTDLLLESLNDFIHKMNEGREIDEYVIPTTTELDDSDLGPSSRAIRMDDDIGSYRNALEILGFQHLREYDEGKEAEKYPE